MAFKTPNSSFILDLLLRSITLCAVLRAIFLPATLVELGCLLLVAFAFLDEPAEPFEVGRFSAGGSFCVDFGFIWMMVLERVGGGGREKLGLVEDWMSFGADADAVLLRL